MNCSLPSPPLQPPPLERLAGALVQGAALELYLTPKPGLVDLTDCGAHPDLSLAIMERSLRIVADYLTAVVGSLAVGEAFAAQRALGIEAETQLQRQLGTNTHKGYIFLAGLLLIARQRAGTGDETALRHAFAKLSADFFGAAGATASHGRRVRERYGSRGIVGEALDGLPALFDAALPAFRRMLGDSGCFTRASFAMLGALMQTVDDTTALHRAGPPGLARLRRDGQRLQQLVEVDGDYIGHLQACNRDYIALNLTMGGVADLVGLAYGWLLAGGEVSATTLACHGRAMDHGDRIPIRGQYALSSVSS